MVTTAKADLRKQQRDRVEAERVLANRLRYGKKSAASMPKIVAGAKKRQAQVSAAKYRPSTRTASGRHASG